MMKSKKAKDLEPGDVLALPFGKRATVATVDVGRRFVNLRYCEEDTPTGRIERGQEVMLEGGDE